MQEMLNKMVACARTGIVAPEDGSRTIHACAALLGLPLANQIPQTDIVLTGMLKTTTAKDVERTFHQYGVVVAAAVASGEKGFGKFPVTMIT